MTAATTAENRKTIFARALEFFERNPDEILTRADLAIKFDCRIDTACIVAKALIREGISRNQLPRDDARVEMRKRRDAKPFPHNLAPAERRAVEAYEKRGNHADAAAEAGVSYNSMETYLKVARRKAGVKSTKLLVECYQAARLDGQALGVS